MKLVIDTEQDSTWKYKASYSSVGKQGWDFSFLKNKLSMDFDDVIVFHDFNLIETEFSPYDLTYLTSKFSEAAFAEAWNDEDDSYWDSYL